MKYFIWAKNMSRKMESHAEQIYAVAAGFVF